MPAGTATDKGFAVLLRVVQVKLAEGFCGFTDLTASASQFCDRQAVAISKDASNVMIRGLITGSSGFLQ
jgi:hypothetical protein